MPLTPTPAPLAVQTTRTTGGAVLAYASVPVTVSGATATATVQAESSGGAASLGTGVVVVGVTAVVNVAAYGGTASLVSGTGPITLAGATATINVTAPAGSAAVGSVVAGDMWQAPTVNSSTGGGTTWSTASYVSQTDEPPDAAGYRSRWFKFTGSAGDFTFTATAGTAVIVEVYDVGSNLTDPSEWSLAGTSTGTTATVSSVFPDSENGIYVRVAATTDTSYSITLNYSTEAAPTDDSSGGTGGLLQVYDPVIEVAPGSVTFAIFNLNEEETVSVNLIPNPFGWSSLSVTADESGVILGESFELPGELPAGTYTLRATHGSGTASDSFLIQSEPILHPENDDDTATDDAPPAGPFTRWTFVDPAGLMSDFVFTYNPSTMTAPYVPRTYVSDSTTSPVGQAQVWEALSPGADWQFDGYLDSEAELDALLEWLDVNRRIWVIDHRQRKWVVALVSIDPQPKRVFATPYATAYSVKALLFKEAV